MMEVGSLLLLEGCESPDWGRSTKSHEISRSHRNEFSVFGVGSWIESFSFFFNNL